jgi:parallel beta-helix repeat protein
MIKFTQGGIYMFKQSRYLLFAVALALSCSINKNAQGLETTTPSAENIKLDTTTERIATALHLPTLSNNPLAPAKKVIVVPGDYPTIQAAINAAEMNTVIHVKPGDYAESLNLKSGVSIKGLDVNGVVIHCDAIDGPVIKVKDCNSLAISDLTLKHTGLERMPADFEGQFPLLLLDSSNILVARCKIHNSGGNGITVKGGNNTIWECNIFKNKRNGVSVIESARVVIGKNNCSSNGIDGIHFNMAVFGTVFDNICNRNVYQGIYASSDCNAFLLDNTCEENKVNGIYFNAGAKGRISKNTCTANGYSGIALFGSGTTALLEQNVAKGNNRNGIYFGDKAGGEARNNECSENKYHGISIDNEWCTPSIHNNYCFKNKHCGLYLTTPFRAGLANNKFDDNGDIGWEIADLRDTGKFEQLETIASRLRNEKCRYSNGNWQLTHFYTLLGEGWYIPEYFPQIKSRLDKWIEEYPNSVTPRIALAIAYKAVAWEARGGGYAYEVSEKGWKEFKENLEKAEKLLIEAEDLNVPDPELYETWLDVGIGLSKTDEEMNALFEKGIAIERNYWPLYTTRGFALAPIWYGHQGELAAFARHAVELTRQDEGQILYAKIAQMMIGKENYEPPQYKQLGFSYQMLKQSYEDLLKRYPDTNDSYLLNVSCFLACAYEDKEEAKNLFVQIGSNWDKNVWVSEDIFNKYKNWAITKEEKPPEPNE